MVIHYIGADVHCNNTELAVEQKGRIVRRYSVATTVRAIRDVLDEIGGTRHLALEEGPLAGWLYRNLVDQVDTLVVCNPRRNKLIAEDDGDKDDPMMRPSWRPCCGAATSGRCITVGTKTGYGSRNGWRCITTGSRRPHGASTRFGLRAASWDRHPPTRTSGCPGPGDLAGFTGIGGSGRAVSDGVDEL